MKIGVISDTHNFLDPQVSSLLGGVEHIFHAGDIGSPRIILELERIAPVTAVLGNTDDPGLHYRETELVELAGKKFLLHHIVDPETPSDRLRDLLARTQPDVVIFGHTHRAYNQVIGGRLFFNPGAAGKARFGLERTLAVLQCSSRTIRAELLRL